MTPDQLEDVRRLDASGLNYTDIGRALGVDRKTVGRWLNNGDAILAHYEARSKGRKPRHRYRNTEVEARRDELVPKILAALDASEPMTASNLADSLGVENVKIISSLLCSLERSNQVTRAGVAKVGKNIFPLFGKIGTAHQTESAPKRIAPVLQYRSPFSDFMGEPPIGRSALDMRMRA